MTKIQIPHQVYSRRQAIEAEERPDDCKTTEMCFCQSDPAAFGDPWKINISLDCKFHKFLQMAGKAKTVNLKESTPVNNTALFVLQGAIASVLGQVPTVGINFMAAGGAITVEYAGDVSAEQKVTFISTSI